MMQIVVITRANNKRAAISMPYVRSLQRSVLLLRASGLLLESTFPALLSPIETIDTFYLLAGKSTRSRWFLVKIGIRKSFTPSELWLKFNKRVNSVWVSDDKIRWVCISCEPFKTWADEMQLNHVW